MSDEKLSRRDVDSFAAKILVGFGLLNAATLAAADIKDFDVTPFAIGLIGAVVAQVWWYVDMALEHAFEGKTFLNPNWQIATNITSTITIIGGSVISAACIVIGCLQLIGTHWLWCLLFSFSLCLLPVIIMFGIGTYKAIKN